MRVHALEPLCESLDELKQLELTALLAVLRPPIGRETAQELFARWHGAEAGSEDLADEPRMQRLELELVGRPPKVRYGAWPPVSANPFKHVAEKGQ